MSMPHHLKRKEIKNFVDLLNEGTKMLILERKRKVSKVNEIKNKGSKLHVIFFCSINEALYFLIKTKRTSIINYLAKNTSIINYLYLNFFFG